MSEPDLFAAIQHIADGPTVAEQGGLAGALMTRLHENGLSIERLADERVMNRKPETLKRHARKLGLAFSDYVPMKLRKIAEFEKTGDFYEVSGPVATDVAKCLGLVQAERDGTPVCGIPAHRAAEWRGLLEAAWFRVRGLPRAI